MDSNITKVAKHFNIPYATILRWSKDDKLGWRKTLYEYLKKRYIKETLEALNEL